MPTKIKKPMAEAHKEQYKEGVFTMGRCTVIVSKDNGIWHLSISTPYAQPSYKELKEARYKYLPDDIFAAQIFPPSNQFVNLHPYCHHLYELTQDEIPYDEERKDCTTQSTGQREQNPS